MGQKFAAYDALGAIVGFYDREDSPPPLSATVLKITDAEWQACISTPGYTVNDGALVAPAAPTQAELLARARAEQSAALSQACSDAIASGFTSCALGSPYMYPSSLTDQTNQTTVASCSAGGYLWCALSGQWALAQHTQGEAQAVLASFALWLNKCQQQCASLIEQVNKGKSIVEIRTVSWVNPI